MTTVGSTLDDDKAHGGFFPPFFSLRFLKIFKSQVRVKSLILFSYLFTSLEGKHTSDSLITLNRVKI